jgi:hypothetical protein
MIRENINNILNITTTAATTQQQISSNSATQQQKQQQEQMDSKLIDHTLESGLIENSELTSLYNDKLNGLKINSNLTDASGEFLEIFCPFPGPNFPILKFQLISRGC